LPGRGGTDYFGTVVYAGDARATSGEAADKYTNGVQAEALALSLMMLVAFLYSLALPAILESVGVKATLRIGNAVLATSLLTLAWHNTPTQLSATFVYTCLGVPWATTLNVLWVVVALSNKTRAAPNPATYNGIFLTSMCCPQIFLGIIGAIMFYGGAPNERRPLHDGNQSMFLVGACGAVVAFLSVPILVTPEHYESLPAEGDTLDAEEEPFNVGVQRRGYSVAYKAESLQSYGTIGCS
jgi:MFS family permease